VTGALPAGKAQRDAFSHGTTAQATTRTAQVMTNYGKIAGARLSKMTHAADGP
jgi:uncharacterized phage-associated protein